MKKYLFTLLLVILGIASAFAQKSENDTIRYCGTPNLPRSEMEKLLWYGNNQFLYDFLEGLEGSKNGRTERVFEGYQVAVQAWVYHKDNGSGTVPENWEIMCWLNVVNEVYELNNVPIKLYLLCNPVHINRTRYYENIDSESEFDDMVGESYNPNALNIHFVWDNYRNAVFSSWQGRAKFPNYYPNPYSLGIRTNRGVIGNETNQGDIPKQKELVSTLIHEIGHTLGLVHTHQGGQLGSNNPDNDRVNRCEQEYVDRRKILEAACSQFTNSPFLAAEYNGDAIMDTPAAQT